MGHGFVEGARDTEKESHVLSGEGLGFRRGAHEGAHLEPSGGLALDRGGIDHPHRAEIAGGGVIIGQRFIGEIGHEGGAPFDGLHHRLGPALVRDLPQLVHQAKLALQNGLDRARIGDRPGILGIDQDRIPGARTADPHAPGLVKLVEAGAVVRETLRIEEIHEILQPGRVVFAALEGEDRRVGVKVAGDHVLVVDEGDGLPPTDEELVDGVLGLAGESVDGGGAHGGHSRLGRLRTIDLNRVNNEEEVEIVEWVVLVARFHGLDVEGHRHHVVVLLEVAVEGPRRAAPAPTHEPGLASHRDFVAFQEPDLELAGARH